MEILTCPGKQTGRKTIFISVKFQYKLLITFAVFFGAALAAMVYFFNESQRQLLDKIDKDFENVIKSVHYSTQRLSSEKSADRQELTSFIEGATRNKSVNEITVVNKDEQVVASSNPKNIGAKRSVTGKETIIREQFGAEDTKGHNRYVINIPIIRDGKPIGLVQTSIVLHDFSLFMRQYSEKAILAAAAALLAIFIISSVVLLQLSRPLNMLTTAARGVAEGDYSAKLPKPSRDEIGQLSRAFATMVEKLGEQKKIEDRLSLLERQAILSETAAVVSHEIRNPLNMINLTADHLIHTFKKSSPQQADAGLETIIGDFKAQIRQLNRMVEEFLAIGKPARITKTRFRLQEFFSQIEVLIKQQLMSKKLEVEKNIPTKLALFADREQLQLVFLNIMINAAEMVPESGRIAVDASEEEGTVVIRIADNGPGVAAEDVNKIFEPYFSKRPGGTGLGLTLARRIIEQHGGRVAAKPKEQAGGGCFEMRLPKEP